MVKKLLSYFNKNLKFYENLKAVENQSNQDIVGSCKRYLALCPTNEAAACVGKAVYIIGEFDDENLVAPVISYDEPVLIVDCDDILKERIPQAYESKNN